MKELFYQHNVPANQAIYYDTAEHAKSAVLGDLNICLDDDGYIFNQAFDIAKVNYSKEYNAPFSPNKSQYVHSQIKWLLSYLPQGAAIVEVGCGKGYYINQIAKLRNDCRIDGFDTSYVPDDTERSANLVIYDHYYNKEYKYLNPAVVICRHVIEHIPDPLLFLHEINETMEKGALLLLETPDVEWILKNNMIFDFYYEHCSYWSVCSLSNALAHTGFEIVAVDRVFESQYLQILAKKTDKKINLDIVDDAKIIKKLCDNFVKKRENVVSAINQSLNNYVKQKLNIALLGAAGKGVTFANMFDSRREKISCLLDSDKGKWNKHIGGSVHIVLSPDKYIEMMNTGGGNTGIVIVMNSNYLDYNKHYFSDSKNINVIDIFELMSLGNL